MIDIQNYLKISPAAKTIVSPYSKPADFPDTYDRLYPGEKKLYLRHFIVNNIPFAFQQKPLVFEQIVQYLADKFDINTTDIKLVGSAKTGFSMSPSSYGKPFDTNSDLDFAIINETLFNELKEEFLSWKDQFERGIAVPKNNTEKIYWHENKLNVPFHLKNGFIDTYKIPNHDQFQLTRKINNSLYLIWVNLRRIQHIAVSKVSLRVFDSWPAFTSRLKMNTERIFEKKKN